MLDASTAQSLPALQLLFAALSGVALIVFLIARLRLHPFLTLTLASLLASLLAGRDLNAALQSYSKGFGDTMAGVGILIALGAVFGRLLADSGGADAIVSTLLARASPRALPWMMALLGALIGLPLFFEVGLVLIMPVIARVATQSGVAPLRLGMPALAGLSAMHGLVPPHPGPLVAVEALGADMGQTLALGVLIAVPTTVIAGPVFAALAPWVRGSSSVEAERERTAAAAERQPPFVLALACMLLPIALMMAKAIAELWSEKGLLQRVLSFAGKPMLALLCSVLFALVALGRGARMDRRELAKSVDASLPPIASIALIVAAGGGFKQTLIDTGIGTVASTWVHSSEMSPLLLAWLLAVSIRLATGSATVATITASGLLAPVALGLSGRSLAARSRSRRRIPVLLTSERCGVLAGQGVLRPECQSDPEELVDHGDDTVGGGIATGTVIE